VISIPNIIPSYTHTHGCSRRGSASPAVVQPSARRSSTWITNGALHKRTIDLCRQPIRDLTSRCHFKYCTSTCQRRHSFTQPLDLMEASYSTTDEAQTGEALDTTTDEPRLEDEPHARCGNLGLRYTKSHLSSQADKLWECQ